jgi:hypothetical protein
VPIPIPQPSGNQHSTVQPYHRRQFENWAVEQERQRHLDAIYRLGEHTMFVLMWSPIDAAAGLVNRCPRCNGASNSIASRVGAVYQQPSINKCPVCFGTDFEGGYRAKIVRPALWADNDETEKLDRRGIVHPEAVTIESTWDFRMRQGDYIFRADGSRWRASDSPHRVTLRTGFLHPGQKDTSITYNRVPARYEEKDTVAYMIPPTDADTLHALLTNPGYFPQDFSASEDIRGPLIPPDALRD